MVRRQSPSASSMAASLSGPTGSAADLSRTGSVARKAKNASPATEDARAAGKARAGNFPTREARTDIGKAAAKGKAPSVVAPAARDALEANQQGRHPCLNGAGAAAANGGIVRCVIGGRGVEQPHAKQLPARIAGAPQQVAPAAAGAEDSAAPALRVVVEGKPAPLGPGRDCGPGFGPGRSPAAAHFASEVAVSSE